ncbi:MAG: PEP-CTERM sorting domain-containing protein [Thermoguttaceae bacterium]|jgi:hypothetical protein
MVRKLFYVVLVLAMAGTAYAQVDTWLGTNSNDWMDKTNWSLGIVPTTDVDPDTFLMLVANTEIGGGHPHNPLISLGQNASTATYDTWGPELGGQLDIQGGTYSGSANCGFVLYSHATDATAVLNLGAGGTGGTIDVNNFCIGDDWWAHDGPNVVYNQYSGYAHSNYLWIGGKVNVSGGELKDTGWFWLAADGETPAQCTIDISGTGKVSLPAGIDPDDIYIPGWIAAGYITANGGGGTVIEDRISEPGQIVLTAPEPSTITMLCIAGLFGGLALIRRKRS